MQEAIDLLPEPNASSDYYNDPMRYSSVPPISEEQINALTQQPDKIPKPLQERYYSVVSRALQLGFIEPDKANIILHELAILTEFYEASKPSGTMTHDDFLHLKNIDILSIVNISRALGIREQRMNERMALISGMRGELNQARPDKRPNVADWLFRRNKYG